VTRDRVGTDGDVPVDDRDRVGTTRRASRPGARHGAGAALAQS
jgi:hypothetical protein